jgi:8-oxo-dGTP pyrophosphatase MutT (NUDIX family)/phosphohistidine phosphatase SixA
MHEVRAGGGVVWRRTPDDTGVEVAIIHRPRYDDWSFPKGKVDQGESEFDAALREVLEETGYRVRPGRALGEVRYEQRNGTRREKVVRYWAMQATGGTFTPNHEVDELRWLGLDDVEQGLTRDTDREIFERFRTGPISTRTVLLVRHGSAGNRSEWPGDDRLRPLDETGLRQATELVRMLSPFDIRSIVSADFVRCVQTMEPLGASLALDIREEPLLSEDDFPEREAQALELLRELGDDDESVAVCSQRRVVPHLIERLAAEDAVDLPHARCKKGSVWALSFDGRHLCGAEYFPPPPLED